MTQQATMEPETLSKPQIEPPEDLKENGGWTMAFGGLFVLAGVIGLGMSVTVTLATVMIFGAFLFFGGAVQCVDAFAGSSDSRLLNGLVGLVYLIAGAALLTQPVAGSLLLTLVLGAMFLAVCVSRVALGFGLRGSMPARCLIGLAGLASIIVGGLILAQWPSTALWVIGMLISIELILHGCSKLALGLALTRVT